MRIAGRQLTSLLIILLLIAACREATPGLVSPPLSHTTTPIGITQPVPTLETSLLPHAIYFLSDLEAGIPQVWRLAPNGTVLSQITTHLGGNPVEGVRDYDVSPSDGTLALAVGLHLYLIDSSAEDPFLLANAGSTGDGNPENLVHHSFSPRWSPDGQYLAFALGGINTYRPGTGEIINILPDQGRDSLYFPYMWSPDGMRLLVSISQSEKSNLGVLTITNGELVVFAPGTVCCQASWVSDSRTVLVANPYPEITDTGLWRFDSHTGTGTLLVSAQSVDGSFHLVGWPLLDDSGGLFYFYSNALSPPVEAIPMNLVRSGMDTPDQRSTVRPDMFMPKEVLWSPQGDLAVVVLPSPGSSTWSPGGPVVLIDTHGNPVQPLIASGYNLHWGP